MTAAHVVHSTDEIGVESPGAETVRERVLRLGEVVELKGRQT